MTFSLDIQGYAAPGIGMPRALPEEAARQGFMRQNIALDVDNHSASGKQFSIVARNFGSVRVANIDPPPSTFTRAKKHLADGKDIVSLVISRGGRFRIDGVEGETSCGAHGAAVLESRRESVLHSPDAIPVWTICMDRAPLEPLICDTRKPLQQCVQGDDPALCLLGGYLGALGRLDRVCQPALISQHIRELALCALGISRDAQAFVRERGARDARLLTVLDQLAQAAVEPGLDPSRFAAQLNLSVRYLHRMLEPSGRTFSEHLLAFRLAHAEAMLRDPQLTRLRIGEIAARAGFADISHFNRSFRQTFAETPSEFRASAARVPRPSVGTAR